MQIKGIILTLLFLFSLSITLYSDSYISYFEGNMTVKRGSETIVGEYGLPLLKSDVVQTGSNSLAILEIEGRGTLKMRADTTLSLNNLGGKIEVSLKSGGIFSKIKRILGLEYEVVTRDVVAGVRGTEFFMAYGMTIEETPDLWLCVNEGTVEVALQTGGESLLVTEGKGITIPAGNRLTPPKFYSWTEDLNWNNDPEKGSLLDETDLKAAYADLRDFDYD